jgi:hypothetical protein
VLSELCVFGEEFCGDFFECSDGFGVDEFLFDVVGFHHFFIDLRVKLFEFGDVEQPRFFSLFPKLFIKLFEQLSNGFFDSDKDILLDLVEEVIDFALFGFVIFDDGSLW